MIRRELKKIISLMLVLAMMVPLPAYAAELDIDPAGTEESILQTQDGLESGITTEPAEEDTDLWEDDFSPVEEAGEPEETTDPTENTAEAAEETASSTEETGEPVEETTDPMAETVEAEEVISEEAEAELSESFSCYTLDDRGNRLEGYWSEEDESWYLFLTSTQAVGDAVIYYTGTVTGASYGQLDMENAAVRGAFAASGDKVILKCADETEYTVTVLQSNLPSVYITLNGTTLDTVNDGSKDTKYPGNTVVIMDPSGKYDLTAENSVEFKGRGNSTWMFFDKKGYQIKFDSKISVLGMGKAKKWVLLANAADETLLHNMLAFDLAAQMDMEYVPAFRFVDLWIDGEYRGNYIIGDKVEIGSSRLDLQHPDGTLFEQDQGFYYEEDYYFSSSPLRKYFVVKETNADDKDTAKMNEIMDVFHRKLDELAIYLYTTPAKEVTMEKLETMIDVDSIAKYYIINEYTCNTESTAGSFYWYQDGPEDILHVGPVWDFDSSMGNEKSDVQYYMKNHILFQCLLAVPVFYNRTVELYNQYKSAFDAMASRAAAMKTQIADSAAMNYVRWNVWGQANPKETLKDYSASYEEGFSKLTSWLSSRASTFQVQSADTAWTSVDEDCSTLDVFYAADTDPSRVEFAVWSDQNGQDDMKTYSAEKGEDGVWHAAIDLSVHQTTAKYTIHVYTTVNGKRSRVAAGYAYVAKTNEPAVEASLSEDGRTIGITARYVGGYTNVRAEVWCDTEGQDDLATYPLEKQSDFTCTASVNVTDHNQTGTYEIRLYGTNNGNESLIALTAVENVDTVIFPEVQAKLSDDFRSVAVTARNTDGYTNVYAEVWCEIDGKDDVKEYPLEKQSDNTLTAAVSLADHKQAGTYEIRLYGTKSEKNILIAQTSVDAAKGIWPMVSVEVADGIMTLTLKNGEAYTSVWYLVWSEEDGDSDKMWYEAEQGSDGSWIHSLNTASHGETGVYQIRVYVNDKQTLLESLETVVDITLVPIYRLYNPYTLEHLLTANGSEKDELLDIGWQLDGIAWKAPIPGNAVFRLYNPYDDWHTYSMSEEEIDMLTALGWKVDGVVFCSAREKDGVPVYRLFNPYEQKNYHLLTISEAERDQLLGLGWTLDGKALYAAKTNSGK